MGPVSRLRKSFVLVVGVTCLYMCVFLTKPTTFKDSLQTGVSPECIDCIQVNRSIHIKGFQDFVFPEPNCHGKLLVFECLHDDTCGGLADRQKGVMSAFLLALLTNRTFVLNHQKTCDMKNVMPPRVYNWFKCLPYLGLYKFKGETTIKFIDEKGNFPKDFTNFQPGDIWSENIVKIHLNSRLNNIIKTHPDAKTMLPWLFNASDSDIVTGLMKLLFHLSEDLQTHINMFINTHTFNRQKKLVGAHIRTAFLKDNEIQIFLDYLTQYNDTSKYAIYVATDNISIRELAKQRIGNLVSSDIDIVHVDKTTSKSCKGMYGAVFEQHILASADILILSNSGFSRLAAYIRDRSDNIFYFIGKTDSIEAHFDPVNLDDIAMMFPTR